jgi:lysophospholipase L1-like esterase
MNKTIVLYLLCICHFHYSHSQAMSSKTYTYLALGDSYTIGEQVAARDNFPHQTVALLAKDNFSFQQPVIVAKTGWTTDELQVGIALAGLDKKYDFVSLLIGVNNQYRGRDKAEYAQQFEKLLRQSIQFAGNIPEHVFVLSIPDWGVTPFAEGRDRNQIADEIDAFNSINKDLASKYNVHYIDITPGTRQAYNDLSLLAEDQLHPSGKEYSSWAQELARAIRKQVK